VLLYAVTFFSLFAYRTKFFSCPFFIFTKILVTMLWQNHHNISFRPFGIRRSFHGAILPQSACAGCNEIVTTFMIEKPLPKAWHGHVLGSGGHQTDSEPASVLANKPQER